MKNSSYYIAPVGDRTHDLPHTVASNMVKVSHALNHSATEAVISQWSAHMICLTIKPLPQYNIGYNADTTLTRTFNKLRLITPYAPSTDRYTLEECWPILYQNTNRLSQARSPMIKSSYSTGTSSSENT